MADSEAVVTDDVAVVSSSEEERRDRRWWGLLVIVALLLLLLLCSLSSYSQWYGGGGKQARFIARNAECLKCHVEHLADFKRASVHSPFETKNCTSCHTKHGKIVSVTITTQSRYLWRSTTNFVRWLPLRWWFRLTGGTAWNPVEDVHAQTTTITKTNQIKGATSTLIMPEEKLCWLCHGSLGAKLNDTNQHQPFKTGRCTNCHNPHASDYSVLLKQPKNELCFTCHPMGAQLGRMQSHPPAKNGWCTDCHDPHASNFKGMLVANQTDLCFRCHPTVASKSGMPVQHAPFANGNCTGCHEPHGSDYVPLLLSKQPALCYKCHPAIKSQFSQASHHPVGLDLTCASCHDPHAAQYAGLLSARNNEFCYKCHGEFKAAFEPSLHSQTLCIGCHTPHGSANAPILRKPNPDLCLTCHSASSYDDSSKGITRNNHPVRPAYYDVNARKRLTCTTSCHNPHGTDYKHMLRYFAAGSDGNCLMCHAVKKNHRIAIDF